MESGSTATVWRGAAEVQHRVSFPKPVRDFKSVCCQLLLSSTWNCKSKKSIFVMEGFWKQLLLQRGFADGCSQSKFPAQAKLHAGMPASAHCGHWRQQFPTRLEPHYMLHVCFVILIHQPSTCKTQKRCRLISFTEWHHTHQCTFLGCRTSPMVFHILLCAKPLPRIQRVPTLHVLGVAVLIF